MKENTIEIEALGIHLQQDENEWMTRIPKSDTKITDLRQFGILHETAERFVPVRVTESGDDFIFHFLIQKEWRTWSKIKNRTRAERLRLLSNIASLFHGLPARITLSLHPHNLVFNENLMPLVIYRGIRGLVPPFEMPDETLLKQYKCLAIAMFAKELSFDQLYNGSLAEANETEFERNVNETGSIGELAAFLKERYQEEQKKSDETMQLVPSKRFKLFRWLAFSMIALAVLLAIPLGYILLVKQPFDQHLLEAHRNNLAADYDGVITALQDANPEKLPDPAKYILANAYVKTENLNQKEKAVVLRNVSLKSDPNYLLYWIYSGRGEPEQAIDLAKVLDDPRLIMYGLYKKIEKDRNDPELSGEERDEQIRKAQDELKRYREEYNLNDPAEETMEQDSEATEQKQKQDEQKKLEEQKKQAEQKKEEATKREAEEKKKAEPQKK